MGFVRILCEACRGSKIEEVSVGHGCVQEIFCSNCNGEGNIVAHAGAIGSSYAISTDPATEWATLWRKHDDGQLELIESSKVPPYVPPEQH